MTNEPITFGFPFAVNTGGRIAASGGDEAVRSKIIQVLFTAPGERVNKPDFGCGLFDLVFEPNDPILAASMEFTIRQALARWLQDDIAVHDVDVESVDEGVVVQVVYTRAEDEEQQAVQIEFS